MIDKIPLLPYKHHQGEGDQYSYTGIALSKVEQIMADKINEMIDMANELVSVGLGGFAEGGTSSCCTEEDKHDN